MAAGVSHSTGSILRIVPAFVLGLGLLATVALIAEKRGHARSEESRSQSFIAARAIGN